MDMHELGEPATAIEALKLTECHWGSFLGIAGDDLPMYGRKLDEASANWAGLPVCTEQLPGKAEVRDVHTKQARFVMALSGNGTRQFRRGAVTRDLYTAPKMVEFLAADDWMDRGVWNGDRGEVLAIDLPTHQVERLLHTEGSGFKLDTAHEMFDDRLARLAVAIWEEARNGAPTGPLYGDGLSLALLGVLEQRGVTRAGADRSIRSKRLSARQRVMLCDYIETHLGIQLTVDRLAALVHMSPAHFSRVFKATLGSPPHTYVTERRIERAMNLLGKSNAPAMSDLSQLLGFSSQSHFTTVFRQKVGTTPSAWRRA